MRLPSPARVAFLLATAALFAVLVHAAFTRASSPAPLVAVLVWVALSTLGVFFPWLEMYGPSLSRGPRGRGEVALTFDDGPHPESTRRVLELLAATRHRATFFVLGEKARRHPDVVREIHRAGHTLGIHGEVHDRLHSFRDARRVAREIAAAQAAVEACTGERPEWFRPPLGHTSPSTMRGIRNAGVRVVGWSARGYDGLARRDARAVVRRIEGGLEEGAVVLLHDAAERDDFEPAGVAALPEILALLDARGLTSVGLSAWSRSAAP